MIMKSLGELIRFYFTYKGRVSRKQYIIGNIVSIIITNLFLSAIFLLHMLLEQFISLTSFLWIFLSIFIFSYLFGAFSFTVRRIKDLDGKWYLFIYLFLPVLNFIALIYFLFVKGTEGDNKYGPDPTIEKPPIKDSESKNNNSVKKVDVKNTFQCSQCGTFLDKGVSSCSKCKAVF